MSASDSEPVKAEVSVPTAPARRTGNSQLCPGCEKLNPLGRETCERCGEPLFADCRHCGAHNPRTSTRCPKCGRSQDKVRRNRFKNLSHSPLFWVVIVIGIGVLLALLLLVWLGGGRLPRI